MTNAVIIAQQGANNTTFRNRIINGAMGIWQRGTSSTSAGYQTADRWYENASNTTTFAQETSNLPSGFQYALKLTAGATAQMWIQQPIETKNCYDLQGQSVTLSVYLAASVSTSVTLYLYYSTSTDNPAAGSWTAVSSSTVTATSSYARYTVTFTVPSNALTIMPQIITTSTVSNGTILYITGVQLEAGTTASPFEYRSYGVELALCQRYYYKNLPGASNSPLGTGPCVSTTASYQMTPFPVAMRIAPTALEQSGTAADYNTLHAGSTYVNNAVPTFIVANTFAASSQFANAGAMNSVGGAMARTNSTTGYLAWSAEL